MIVYREDQASLELELLAIVNSWKMMVEWKQTEMAFSRRVARRFAKIHFGILDGLPGAINHNIGQIMLIRPKSKDTLDGKSNGSLEHRPKNHHALFASSSDLGEAWKIIKFKHTSRRQSSSATPESQHLCDFLRRMIKNLPYHSMPGLDQTPSVASAPCLKPFHSL